MIILRQKEYSLRGTRIIAGINNKLLRKPLIKSKRDAIKVQDKALGVVAKGLNKIEKGKKALNEAALNPGGSFNKFTEEAIRHPITVGTNVVGKVTMVTDPTGTGLIPLGSIGTAAEGALRKYSPKYSKATDKMANKYRRSGLSRKVEKGVNALSGAIINTANSL